MLKSNSATIISLCCTFNVCGETSEHTNSRACTANNYQPCASFCTSTSILSHNTLLRAGPMAPHPLKRPPLVLGMGRVQEGPHSLSPFQGALWSSVPNGALIGCPKELLNLSLWLVAHICYFFHQIVWDWATRTVLTRWSGLSPILYRD